MNTDYIKTLELAWKNNLDTENTGFTFYGNFNIKKKKKSKFQESYDQKKFRMIKIIILAMYYTTP